MSLKELKPELTKKYLDFSKELDRSGVLSQKEKELIAVAVAHAIRCKYCIEDHTKKARAVGATDEEIAEAVFVAARVSAGSVLTYAQHHAFKGP